MLRVSEEQGGVKHCIVCYAGSLIVAVILGVLLLIAHMEMAVCYEKKMLVDKTK